jgi:hypothetical protein
MYPWNDGIPRWDQWNEIAVWEAHYEGRPVLPLILERYNGHIIALPRLITFGLGLLTDWSLRAELLVLYLLAMATAAVFILMLRDSGERALLLAAPVTLLVFSVGQYASFLTSYAIGQHLCQLGIASTIFAMTRPRLSWPHLVAASVAAAVATFSWGGGLLAWPLGGVALLLRIPRRWPIWLVWGALSLAAAGVVVRQGTGLPPLWYILSHPDFALFALTLLGKPICSQPFPPASMALFAGIVLAVVLSPILLWAGRLRQPLLLLRWGLLGASGVGAAILIALARPGPLEHALAPHYSAATYPLALSLMVLLCHVLWAWMDRSPTRAGRLAAGAAVLLFLSLVGARELLLAHRLVPTLASWAQISRELGDRFKESRATDQEIQTYFHPDLELVRHGRDVLRRHRLAMYRDSP